MGVDIRKSRFKRISTSDEREGKFEGLRSERKQKMDWKWESGLSYCVC